MDSDYVMVITWNIQLLHTKLAKMWADVFKRGI